MLISHLLPIDRLAALSIGRADARLPEESVLPLQLGTTLKRDGDDGDTSRGGIIPLRLTMTNSVVDDLRGSSADKAQT
jgi:hypothetical protein